MIPFLKVAVVVMGIMIVAGVVVLAMMMYGKLKNGGETDDAVPVEAVAQQAPVDITSSLTEPAALGLPAGARVQSMIAEGHRLVLVVRVPEEGERLIIVDLRNARITGNIALQGAR